MAAAGDMAERILLIEDDARLAEMVSEYLGEAGFRVSVAAQGRSGLERLAREPFVNVAVTLGFAPEEFHVRLSQTHGVVSGVRGTTVFLNRVPAGDVARIGRYYWVRRVALQ